MNFGKIDFPWGTTIKNLEMIHQQALNPVPPDSQHRVLSVVSNSINMISDSPHGSRETRRLVKKDRN